MNIVGKCAAGPIGRRGAVWAIVSLAMSVVLGNHASAATVAVACPGQSINAAINAAFAGATPSAGELILNVSGTCTENVRTPPLHRVTIVGKGTAIIQPASDNTPALAINGFVRIKSVQVKSSRVNSGPLVDIFDAAFLGMDTTTVTATKTQTLIQVRGQSRLDLLNSTIAGGLEVALQAGENSSMLVHAKGGKTTSIRDALEDTSQAVSCYQSQLTIVTDDATSSVVIGPSGNYGIVSRGCTANLRAQTAGKLRIAGAKQIGIYIKGGDSYNVVNTTISGNGKAIYLEESAELELNGVTIASNVSGINARSGAVVRFNLLAGPSHVSGANRYTCYQNGHIYADAGAIAGVSKSTECLTIDGDETH